MSRVFTLTLFNYLQAGMSPALAYRDTILTLRDASVRDIVLILDPIGSGQALDDETRAILSQMRRRFGDSPPMADLTRMGAFRIVEG